MKSKLFAVAMAAMLMLAMPVLAWASPSPETHKATAENGTSLVVSGGGTVETIEAVSTQAKNIPDGVTAFASFEITGDIPEGETMNLTFGLGEKYAGATVDVYIEHSDGTTDVQEGLTVAADGTLTITIDKLSIFSLVVDDSTATGATGADNGSTSPKTGVDMTAVAGGTAVAAIAAGVVFCALRRKTNE